MKKLILKWLGLDNLLGLDDVEDCVTSLLARRYDLNGLVSNFEDLKYLVEDKEYRWDNTADKVEYFEADDYLLKDELKEFTQEYKEALEKVQAIDDRLTELVAGYRLDVQLIKEDF
jgi:hypothetical protein